MTKTVYDTQMPTHGNMNDMTKTVYNTQMGTDGNMTKTVYDTQMRTDSNMTKAVYDTQIRTGGSMTNAGYDTQLRTHGIPQTKIVTQQNPVYNEVPKSALPRPRGTDYGGGDERAFTAVAVPRPRGTDYRAADKRAFEAADTNQDGVISFDEFTAARAANNPANGSERQNRAIAPPRPRGTDNRGADERAFDAVDTNKNGVISFDEFTAARAASNPANGSERQTRMQTQKYQVPVTKYYK